MAEMHLRARVRSGISKRHKVSPRLRQVPVVHSLALLPSQPPRLHTYEISIRLHLFGLQRSRSSSNKGR